MQPFSFSCRVRADGKEGIWELREFGGYDGTAIWLSLLLLEERLRSQVMLVGQVILASSSRPILNPCRQIKSSRCSLGPWLESREASTGSPGPGESDAETAGRQGGFGNIVDVGASFWATAGKLDLFKDVWSRRISDTPWVE